MLQRRHRRVSYYDRSVRSHSRRIRTAVTLLLVVLIAYVLGGKVLRYFGVGNTVLTSGVVLAVEDNGVINVSLAGGPLKRAEDQLKLYPGDRVVSGPRNFASLDFFDGTRVRIDESTQVMIQKSTSGERESAISLSLEEGTIWVATPALETFSGSIVRTIESPYLKVAIVSSSELIMSERSVVVFSADGLGLPVEIADMRGSMVTIGEGQQFTIPEGDARSSDLYSYRSPLDPRVLNSPFVEESRARASDSGASEGGGAEIPESGVSLVLTSPEDHSVTPLGTVTVSGRIRPPAEQVRINGYIAAMNAATHTFSQEIALSDEDEVLITVEALDADGVVISEIVRTIRRDRKPPDAPTIITPAEAGQTYRTNRTQLEIRGKAPADAVGIIVNDYRLQLFKPGGEEWSYLANVDYGNFVFGENTFTVVAIDSGGFRSDPVTLTIILGEGEEGIVGEASSAPESTGETRSAEARSLSNNPPILPGTITVTSPQPGRGFTISEPVKEFLIEGTVPFGTETVWVNDYRLQLFEPGKGFWNYIASIDLGTLKRGVNEYEIVARNGEGLVLDRFTYTVNFQPGRD